MSTFTSLESLARRYFEKEWRRLYKRQGAMKSRGDYAESEAMSDDSCPVAWLLPELLELVAEDHNRPVYELESVIRRVVLENEFVGACPGAVVDTHHDDIIDHTVKMIVHSLERVRRQALERGEWSDAPITPLMCG